MDEGSERPKLRDTRWATRYSHNDGDLVRLFFEPALSCAKSYRRVTGYFSADVLVLAARGLDALIRHGGRMELVVGCTLERREVEEIEKGYDLRARVEEGLLSRLELSADDARAREQLGWLAWMVASGHLDIRVAVPKDEHGRFRAGLGLYHAKAGILVDDSEDVLVFEGSINETQAGWLVNRETFSVSCSWEGGRDGNRVDSLVREFALLWANRAPFTEVLTFPEACRQKLLEFLPSDDRFVAPPRRVEPEPEPEVLPPDDLRRLVWSFIANAPRRHDGALVAVQTSTVVPWPHQLWAYRRMLDSWPCRLLIADEVGLGKTIEAGLLIRHAWISGLAKRILLLVPAGVLKQWQAELYEKFNLLVPIYTGSALLWPEHHFRQIDLEQPVARDAWVKTPLVLASSHLVRRAERRGELLDAPEWDLVVLDEAHHARRKGAGSAREKGPNRLLELMEGVAPKAKALLLLTATPMQVDPVEIWDLVRLLGIPQEWSAEMFGGYFEALHANPDHQTLLRLAKLFQACEREYGPLPEVEIQRVAEKYELTGVQRTEVLAAVRESKTSIPLKRLPSTARSAAIALLRAGSPLGWRMSRHTRSLLREYHRRGLLDAPIADRDVHDRPIELSPSERKVYEAVENYIDTTYQAAQPDKKTAVGFVMTVYRRRLASSFHALKMTLTDRLDRLTKRDLDRGTRGFEESASLDENCDEAMSPDESVRLAEEALAVEEGESVRALLRDVGRLSMDTKARALVRELQVGFEAGYDAAIVFTEYTDTLDYLKHLVASELEMPVGCYSGSGGARRDRNGNWGSESKEDIKRLLRERAIRILICTDAAGEGLNLQSCGFLVNYDLPWNPMKVEQRIGRIDRIGQKHTKVRIVNLAYEDTVEADVYFALSQRIGLFHGVVGKLQPILSQVARKFEATTLSAVADRARTRQAAAQELSAMVDQTESAAFDIDEVSEADLRAPVFPAAPYEPRDLEHVLARPELLPPGLEIRALDPGTYAVRLPGCTGQVRVTARPEVFDEHFESHQLLLPGSPVFSKLTDGLDAADPADIEPVGTLSELLAGSKAPSRS